MKIVRCKTKISFKTVWYNPKINVLTTPILLDDGRYYYKENDSFGLRVILNTSDWTYVGTL